jgi:hypothetical protein
MYFDNMEAFTEFVKTNWRLIYTVYKGHPNSSSHILGDFADNDDSFTCFFAPYLWIDLFCERDKKAIKHVRDVIFMPGHLYLCEASCHHFTIIYINDEMIIYTDFYEEARGVADGFRVSVMKKAELDAAWAVLRGDDAEAIATFHQADSVEDLDILYERDVRGGKYVQKVTMYPIARIPTLDTLLTVCRTATAFDQALSDEIDGFDSRREAEYTIKWLAALARLTKLC